jgi:hypothetical protein
MKIIYSEQAKVLMENMPDFDKESFEKWWVEQQKNVGSNNVLQFLLHQKRSSDIKIK